MRWIVTGGAGFLGSTAIKKLNEQGISEILVVDHLNKGEKWKNLLDLAFEDYLDREEFLELLRRGALPRPEYILHLGAITDTSEQDMELLRRWNVVYTLALAEYAVQHKVRFVYASSAAVYGDGKLGFSDSEDLLGKLRPLNPYGFSKLWADRLLKQRGFLERAVGVRFFNVYGPREHHKGKMRSVIPIFYAQLYNTGKVRLFRSNDPEIPDGEQKRDFIYSEDAMDATLYLTGKDSCHGLYNIGTGTPRTFLEVVRLMLSHLEKEIFGTRQRWDREGRLPIEWIPLPLEIARSYQNYTCADLTRLRAAGYEKPFRPLEEGIPLYLQELRMKPPSL